MRWDVALKLGRVSNLPTVWTNTLAAIVLAGGTVIGDVASGRTVALLVAMSLAYIGGMYLNDACDAEYDAHFRPERPIPARLVSRRQVYAISYVLLALGFLAALGEGAWAWSPALALLIFIIAYDLLHKHIAWSPVLMGLCRAMIYPAMAGAAVGWIGLRPMLWAAALMAYVVGLSYVARAEDRNALRRYAPVALVLVPVALFLMSAFTSVRIFWSVVTVAWILYCLLYVLGAKHRDFQKAVAGLLAGICLVDFLAVSQVRDPNPWVWQLAILACFGLTLLLQRRIPAT
jgi:4-hydroxybenzoate polyprenyltransferase